MSAQTFLGWSPEQVRVFVVGTLEWKFPEYFSPFPKENRRDAALVKWFRTLGVPQSQLVYLQDKQATSAKIDQKFEALLADSAEDELLVVYYCGHGSKDDDGAVYFASYDTDGEDPPGWYAETIIETIEEQFSGSHVLLIVDACHSGELADQLPKRSKIGYACLASSLASETSTGNWTFTEGLLAGLQGHAFVDANGDNRITLRELAAEIAESMAFAEEQVSVFATTKRFDPDLIVGNARPRIGPRVGERVEAFDGDDWYRAQIIDARNGEFKVHYYGYEESDQQWLKPEQLRAVKWKTFPVGSAVEVKWGKKWYAARVLEVRGGIHHISYDDYDDSWNEWVASSRVRKPRG
jgi:hypothetical protein